MNNKRKLVDDFLYLIELEKPNTRIIKERPKPKNIETQTKPKVEVKKQLEINPIYRYTIDGDLVDKYLNPKQMAKKLSWRESLLRKAADQETLYKGFLITRTSYTKEQIQQRFVKPKKEPKHKSTNNTKPKVVRTPKPKKEKKPYIQQCKVYQYNKDGELVATYDNSGIASKLTSWNHNTIKEYSKRESYYKGFLLTRTEYTPQQAKERFVAALNNQQVSFVYKGGELVAVCTSLSEVKEVIGLGLTLKQISNSKYYKEPLGDYLITSKPL